MDVISIDFGFSSFYRALEFVCDSEDSDSELIEGPSISPSPEPSQDISEEEFEESSEEPSEEPSEESSEVVNEGGENNEVSESVIYDLTDYTPYLENIQNIGILVFVSVVALLLVNSFALGLKR